MQIFSRQYSGHSKFYSGRYAEKLFTQIYRDLTVWRRHAGAHLVGHQHGEKKTNRNMAAGNHQKHLSLSFATKE